MGVVIPIQSNETNVQNVIIGKTIAALLHKYKFVLLGLLVIILFFAFRKKRKP